MDRIQKAQELAFGYHNTGFHCAEAVFKAIVEVYGNGNTRDLTRLGTAFGGGLGRGLSGYLRSFERRGPGGRIPVRPR